MQRFLDTFFFLSLFKKSLVTYRVPSNLNFNWNFGFLATFALIVQILTGLWLAMYFQAGAEISFNSVEYIMRNVRGGWLTRYLHSNGASFFFIVTYLHIGRSLYYGTYKKNTSAWVIGVIIFLLMIITAFLGYVLPWGQMSYWAATVITNFLSIIPVFHTDLLKFVWGDYSVNQNLLIRFFALHYLLPFIILVLVLIHVYAFHVKKSSNPLGTYSKTDAIPFHPYYTAKDSYGIWIYLFFYFIFVFFYPNYLGHPDNYIPANPMVTPKSIVPEWYFLPFFAILKVIPSKTLGVIALVLSILMLLFLPLLHNAFAVNYSFIGLRYTFFGRILFWIFIANFLWLGYIGQCPIEEPFISYGRFSMLLHLHLLGIFTPFMFIIEVMFARFFGAYKKN